jgi:hypothetical protein
MDELTKYIKEQLKQKQKTKDIINALVTNGYEKNTATFNVYKIIIIKYLFITLVVLLISFIFLFAYYKLTTKQYNSQDLFSNEPSKWVVAEDNNQTSIDVAKISKGNSYIEGKSQFYNVPEGGFITVFELNGYYNGSYFDSEFAYGNKTLMRVSKTMKPDDGVIEGFIVERINDYKTNNISAFIFVDSDWKKAMPNTKVFFGQSYQYYTDYIFNEISPGIYMFEIYDDPQRHFENFSISYGGIAVGNLEADNIINNNIEGKTFMRLYS